MLEAEGIKRLGSVNPDQCCHSRWISTTNILHELTFMAVLFEYFAQTVLQRVLIVVIEGSDGWKSTGDSVSLTLSMSDLIVENGFPSLMRVRASYDPMIELP